MVEGEYVYCIIPRNNAPTSFPVKGFEGNQVYNIPFKDLCIIASKATLKDYKPTDESVALHRDVSLHVMKEHSVLPVAFGQVFKNKKILFYNLGKTYLVLKRSMLAMKGKVELGVKAIILENDRAEEAFNGKSLEELKKATESEFLKSLEGLAVKVKSNKLFSERLVLNQSYLVDKKNLDRFSGEVERLTQGFPMLKIQYSGPWPPYNFVSIRIQGGK